MRLHQKTLCRGSVCKQLHVRPFSCTPCLRVGHNGLSVKVTKAPGIACRSTADWASAASVAPTSDSILGLSLGPEAGPDAVQRAPEVQSQETQQSSAEQSHGTQSWESWLKLFEQADTAAESQEEYRLQMQDAVRREDYARAAHLKKELAALEAGDTVSNVLHQLETALAEERYDDAAKLRDEGMASLQGWWCGSAEGDPVGHLLHVGPEYGRWTGRAYTARDLADLSGWREGSGPLQRMRNSSAGGTRTGSGNPFSSSFGSRASGTVGSPALEVFLRQGADGEITGRQAVSLISGAQARTSSSASSSNKQRGSGSSSGGAAVSTAISALSALPGVGPMAKLTISIEQDGATRIRTSAPTGAKGGSGSSSIAPEVAPAPPPPVKTTMSKFSSWEAEEAAATLRELAEVSKSGSQASSSRSSSSGVAVVEPDAVLQAPELPDERLEVVGSVVPRSAESAPSSSSSTSSPARDLVVGSASDEMLVDISAAGAIDMDATVGEDDGEEVVAGARSSRDGEESEEEEEEGDSLFTELHRVPAEVEMVSRDAFVFRVPRDAAPASGSGRGRNGGADDAPAAQFEVLLPLALARSDQAAEALARVAERIARAQRTQGIGRPVAYERVADALKEVLRLLAAGESADVRIPTPGSADDASAAMAAAASSPAASSSATTPSTSSSTISIKYSRVPLDSAKTDPFSGLFIGSFGPHGPELLRLQRCMIDGEETVVATKLTGDDNVPAGVTSFRAKIGRKHKLASRDVYPDDLGITARYKGEGRVAQKGYSAPRWVEGELLVFASGGSPLTGGAELGFVWAVPGERRFLILLNKLDLTACAERP